MSRNLKIISLVSAFVLLLSVCTFAFASGSKAEDVSLSELSAFLTEGLASHLSSHYTKGEVTELEGQGGVAAYYQGTDDDDFEITVSVFDSMGESLESFAKREASLYNSIAIPADDDGQCFTYSSYEQYLNYEDYSWNMLTEEDGLIYKLSFYRLPERAQIGGSSRTFLLPASCSNAAELREESEVAAYEPSEDEKLFGSIQRITVYEIKLELGHDMRDYLADIVRENNFDVRFVTRNGNEYVMLIGRNADGTLDVGFCFMDGGKAYDLCFTVPESAFYDVLTVSQSIR